MHRKASVAALATATVLTLAACAGGASPSGAPSSGPTDSSTEVVDTAALGPAAAELQELYDAALSSGENKVIVYAGQYSLLKPVFDAFSARFPDIQIEGKDTFGAGLEATIGQEVLSQPAERGDITLAPDTTSLSLAGAELLEAYQPPAARELQGDQLVYKDNVLTAVFYSFNGNMINTEVMNTRPESWDALLAPDLAGKVALQDPTKAGGGNGIMTTLANDPRYGIEYAQKLKDNGVVLQPSAAEMQQKVVDGTYGVAIFSSFTRYLQLKADGAPVDFVFPVEGGNWLPITYAGLIVDSPHPNAAKLLINYLYTPEAAEVFPTVGMVSVTPDAPTPDGVPPIAEIDQLKSTPLETRLENQKAYTAQLVDIFN